MKYKINNKLSYWEIEADAVIAITDCCYDATNDTFVMAIKNNKGVDYIVINRKYEIVDTISEKEGINCKFVLAPDKSIWIGMSALNTKKAGEIILPLFDRNRVKKEIVKSDIGVDYSFFWNGCYWGYVVDMFGDKPDKMLQYEFDKMNLYKNRKAYKLETLYNAVPFVDNEELYFCKIDYKNNTLQISKMVEPGNVMNVCEPITVEELDWCRLVKLDESGYKIMGIKNDEIIMLSFDTKGKVLDKKTIHHMDVSEIYSMMDFKVSEDGTIAFSYVSEEQSGIIEIKDSVVTKVLWQKDNMLYGKDIEVEIKNRLAFCIMTDGVKNHYIANSIDVCGGGIKKVFIVDGR